MQQKYIIALAVIAIILVGGYLLFNKKEQAKPMQDQSSQQPQQAAELKIETTQPGNGPEIKAGDIATVNYTGTLTTGTAFDSNVDPKFGHVEPFQFKLGGGQVIQGWDQGILGMKVGEKRKLTIPPQLGYGASGAGNVIPPNATLIFEVELLKIN